MIICAWYSYQAWSLIIFNKVLYIHNDDVIKWNILVWNWLSVHCTSACSHFTPWQHYFDNSANENVNCVVSVQWNWFGHIWKGFKWRFWFQILCLCVCVFGWLSCGNPLSILHRGLFSLGLKKTSSQVMTSVCWCVFISFVWHQIHLQSIQTYQVEVISAMYALYSIHSTVFFNRCCTSVKLVYVCVCACLGTCACMHATLYSSHLVGPSSW